MANNFKHKDISQIFDMVRDRDHYTVIRDFFELSAISIRNNFDHGPEHANFEKRYMEIAQGYKKEYLEGFAKALGLLDEKIRSAVNGDAPFADWAGGLIVAAIDALNDAGVNYSWNAFVDCGDIDPRCVHMTYVTLSLLGVPAVVRLGDALAMEYRQAWFTPAYLMAWPHFKRQIGRGNYPNSATVPKSPEHQEKPQESAPEPPKEEHQELATSMAETAQKCDENGQLSLF